MRRNGQPVAVVGGLTTTWTDGEAVLTGPVAYTVTAVDASGSATGSAEVVSYPASTATVVDWGSTWSFLPSATLPSPGDWKTTAFDDSSWVSGAGGFGWGDAFAVTSTGTTSPHPLATYFRTGFDVDDPARYATIDLEVVAHAGAVVYLNGTEIGRVNMPAGAVGAGTGALPPKPAAQRKLPVSFTVPASMLVAGENTVAAELHLNYRTQPSAYFDAKVVAEG